MKNSRRARSDWVAGRPAVVFDIIGKRNWFFLFSGLILVPGLIFIILTPLTGGKQGLQFSVDYTGGTVWDVQFKNPNVTADQVKAVFVEFGVADAEVTQDSAKYFTVRTKDETLFPQPTPVPPTPTPSPSASASGSPAASSSPSPTASPSLSPTPAPSASASASASVAASPTATASPTPSPAPVLNGVEQNGTTRCQLLLPAAGKLADISAAIQADPKIGPIACTRQTTTVGALISSELITKTVELILLGSLGILIWVGIRFGSVDRKSTR